MKQICFLTSLLLLIGCQSLHRSIKKSNKHRIEEHVAKIESQEDSESIVVDSDFSVTESREESAGSELSVVEDQETGNVVSSSVPQMDEQIEPSGEITEEDLAARAKFDKNFRWTLVSASIGGPLAAGVGILTFNALVWLGIAVPFLIVAVILAYYQIFRITQTVPDSLVDKKFQRRYIFADIVLIVTTVLLGLVLLGLFSRLFNMF